MSYKSFLAVPMLAAGTAFAAVPTEVTTAITDGGADAKSVAVLVIVALIALFAIKLMKKGL